MKVTFYTLIIWAFSICLASAEEPLVIAVGEASIPHRVGQAILQEVYQQLDIPVQFEIMPNQRALVLADAGVIDGDVGRIEGIENDYPGLVRIPTPIFYFTTYAFGTNPDIHINSWSDLKDYRVGILYGVQYMKIETKGMNREFLNNNHDLFNLLIAGRIDVAIGIDAASLYVIRHYYPDQNIHKLGPPLHRAPLFHVLNVKHEALIPLIDEQVKKMQATGQLQSLYGEAVQSVLQQPLMDE